MTSCLRACTRLLLPCCALVTLSTGALDYYRDEAAESTDNIGLRQLMRYLEGHRPAFASLVPSRDARARGKHHADFARGKKRDLLDLEALLEKGGLAEMLRNYRQMEYNEPINELTREREERYYPFYELNPFQSPLEYPNFRLPLFPPDENVGDFEYPLKPAPLMNLPYERENLGKATREETSLDYHRGRYAAPVHGENKDVGEDATRNVAKPRTHPADFTFTFDDSNLRERHPFAVKPNDPRYYQDAPFFMGDREVENTDFEKPVKNNTKWKQEEAAMKKISSVFEERPRDIETKFQDTSVIVVPELERRTEYDPLFVPVTQDLNNDIYFIAIVAGCSAAALFALVLIALTWCRLKRGAKAAADIEYPAYGVTGPNKEISPSGDQRLAQSAQMYHFQHQKQQIIAMEKDPGSVSEAESEEENEEGDYTVYECPGLASTGEMEVKNPLFHDDPTPATPAQTNKEEDHI